MVPAKHLSFTEISSISLCALASYSLSLVYIRFLIAVKSKEVANGISKPSFLQGVPHLDSSCRVSQTGSDFKTMIEVTVHTV